jgi:hypothetical protein
MLNFRAERWKEKTPGVLLVQTLLFTVLIFLGLQWRLPHFSMTDDNLREHYTLFYEAGIHLLHGESPFYSDAIFGGHYDLLRDGQFFLWHPFYLLTSLLAGTPLRLWMIDLDVLFLYLVSAAGFVRLALYFRDEEGVRISDGWIFFCALSYTFTMMALVSGSSWLPFEDNISALPWLALGILQRRWRWGIGLVTLFSLHQVLGGHLQPLVSNSLFLSLFALGICGWRGSFQPLITWFSGYLIAIILISPLLVPMVEGFLESARSGGNGLDEMLKNKIALGVFPSAFLFGTAFQYLNSPPPGTINGIFIFSTAGCAAAWCLFPALFSRAPWRYPEGLCLVLALVAVGLICRPLFVAQIMQHLPVVRSMRWPFRELVQFQFFFHLFILLRPITWPGRVRSWLMLAGSTLFVLPMLLFQVPPTFNLMSLDRQVILSGKLEPYWSQLRTMIKPEDRYVVLVPDGTQQTDSMFVPFSLLGGYDYSMLVHAVNGSGYSQTPPANQYYLHTDLCTPWGAYHLTDCDALWREKPALKLICLEQIHPLRVTLRSHDGAVVDLTPLILNTLAKP